MTSGGNSATLGGTSSGINCALVGCATPPLCSVGCTEICGCCACSEGAVQNGLVCTGGCWAASGGSGGVGGSSSIGGATSVGGSSAAGQSNMGGSTALGAGFTCGTDSCNVGQSYCYHFSAGTGSAASVGCVQLPTACANATDCSCVCSRSTPEGVCSPAAGCTCTSNNDEIQLTCAGA